MSKRKKRFLMAKMRIRVVTNGRTFKPQCLYSGLWRLMGWQDIYWTTFGTYDHARQAAEKWKEAHDDVMGPWKESGGRG